MATKRVKNCDGKAEEHNDLDTTLAVDRISKLPDSVIHHILSFVPTLDAVRTSLLSRRWRRMWYSVPTLRFSEFDGFHCRESFGMFVEQCLIHRSVATRYIADSVVTRLKLDLYFSADIGMSPLNRWSKSPIIRNDVKRLSIFADVKHSFSLGDEDSRPSMTLNGKSLSIIRLVGVRLVDSCSMNLPSLKSLRLNDATFDNNINDVLRNLMIGCPSLEKFVLENCQRYLDHIKISSSSLKFLVILTEFEIVEVDALNLQSLVLDSEDSPQMSFSSCGAIRDLSLNVCNETNQNCGDQISKLTRLENLTLTISGDCQSEQHINVSNPTLKCFSLINYCAFGLKVSTETPNLVSFTYRGYTKFSMAMKTLNPQLSGFFTVCELWKLDPDWYTNLITFLSSINYSWKSLSLSSKVDTDLIIPETMRKTCCPPCPNLKHLKVMIHCKLTRESELRKAMEWISPSLETLSIEGNKWR